MPKKKKDEEETKGRQDYELKEKEGEDKTFESPFKLVLSDDKKEEIVEAAIEEIDRILGDRSDLEEDWAAYKDWYDGVLEDTDFPFEGCANECLPLISNAVDGVKYRAKRATVRARPIILIDPVEKMDVADCKKREDFTDFVLRVETPFIREYGFALHDAINLGTGVLKLPWQVEHERVRDETIYDGSKEGLKEFLNNYPDAQKKYPEFLARLKKKEIVELREQYDNKIYEAPKPQYVALENFIGDRYCKDLNKTRLHGEFMDYTWDDLKRKEKEGFFEDVDSLKWKKDKDGKATNEEVTDYQTKNYQVAEVIFRYDVDDDGLEEKCVYSITKNEKVMLQSIFYPYFHNRTYYHLFYIKPRGDSLYGDGMAKQLEDINIAMNAILHQTEDSWTITNAPSFKAAIGGSYKADNKWYPGSITWLNPGQFDDVEAWNLKGADVRSGMYLIELLQRFAEMSTGIGPHMSGRESPLDPRAPAAKTRMLLAEANVMVSDYIDYLQQTMAEIGYQINQLYYQFMPEGKEFRILGKNGEKLYPKVSRQIVGMRADYIPHGSEITSNPALEFQINTIVFDKMMEMPEVAGDPQKRKYLAQTWLSSVGADWDKKAHEIFRSDKEIKQEKVELMKEAIKQMKEEEAMKMVNEIMGLPAPEAERPPVASAKPARPGAGGMIAGGMAPTGEGV